MRGIQSRGSAILLRWIDVCLCALAAILFIVVADPVFSALAAYVSDAASRLSPGVTGFSVVAIVFLITYPLIRVGGFSPRHLLRLGVYPSSWLSAVLVLLAFFIYGQQLTPADRILHVPIEVWTIAILLALVGIGLSFATASIVSGLRGRIRLRGKSEEQGVWTGDDNLKLEVKGDSDGAHNRLARWIAANGPIRSADQDLFRFDSIAERVARRLSSSDLKSLAFTGPYGCGKTSLRLLVQSKLVRRHFRTCFIDGWGLDEASAPEKILREILNAISNDVDCARLAFLPTRYTEAMKAVSSGLLKPLAELIAGRDPVAVLQELDEVLLAANLRVIIFLEDLDRNTAADALVQVGALLDRLRLLQNVICVISVDARIAGALDLLRLCDYIEPIPPLRKSDIGPVLIDFQEHCLSQFPEDFDFASGEARRGSLTPTQDMVFGIRDSKITSMLARVLDTPRKLNHALRQTWIVWQHLHGEVEFQSLLAAMSLRVAAPEAWTFLCAHGDRVRDVKLSPSERALSGEKTGEGMAIARKKELDEEFDRACEGRTWDIAAILPLIGCLFPAWQPGSPRLLDSPQSLDLTDPTDYWRRILAEEVGGIRDQDFVRLLSAWRSHDPTASAFVQRLGTDEEGWCAKLEQFKALLSAGDILRLASDVVDRVLAQKGVAANMHDENDLICVWRISPRQDADLTKFIVETIKKALPRSIRFATSIEYYWGSTRAGIMSSHRSLRIRRFVGALAKKSITSSDALVAAIDLSDPWVLRRLIRHEQSETRDIEKDWGWFTPILFDALRGNPEIMIPQMANLMAASSDPVLSRSGTILRTHSLDSAFVVRLFPKAEARATLMSFLAKPIDTRSFSSDMQDCIRAVQGAARAWQE